MSMGTSAAYDYTVSEKKLKKIVGAKLVGTLRQYLNAAVGKNAIIAVEGEFDESEYDRDDPDVKKFLDVYGQLCDKFKAATNGLDLTLCYHDQDNCGDRYDDVDGWYWSLTLSQLYAPTKAYLDLQKKYGDDVVEKSFYTIYG